MDSAGPVVLSAGAEVPAVPNARDLEVEPDKLLDAAEVINGQADELRKRVSRELDALRIETPSQDMVSINAVRGWNTVVVEGDESYYQKVLAYADKLATLAEQLRTAGERYRAGEQEQAAAVAQAASGN